ncbi:ABC transporter ATP-binding protein [Nocardioides sp.]|uniref:ABC transporter ATP-binding protein n=1 Tax=Nocardioides sp. TaxID=35761 RepID=UPI0039E3B517
MLNAVLVAEGLTKSFRDGPSVVTAVAGVSLSLRPGEFICLSGASGSGKSTLLGLLAGITPPDAGRICVAGNEIGAATVGFAASVRLKHLGVVFQSDNLLEEFRAWENVALPLEAQGVPTEVARSEAIRVLEQVGVADLSERFPSEMSGGERQRVGVARGVVGGREILLADEPTGALDSKNSRSLFQLVSDLCSHGVAAIVASHDPICRDYATSHRVMVDGRLSAPADDLTPDRS